MANPSVITNADAPLTVTATIPANGLAATWRSLLSAKLATIPANMVVVGIKVGLPGAAYQWGDAANNCIMKVATTDVLQEPCRDGILDTFCETQTGGSTTAPVAIYIASTG